MTFILTNIDSAISISCDFDSELLCQKHHNPWVQVYGSLDPKIINNTCDTEDNGTTRCIKGNPHGIIVGKLHVR